MNCAMVKRILRCGAGWAALAGLPLLCACSHAPLSTNDGGGSRGGNPVVAGMIAGPDGAAARNVRVTLIPEGYNPLTDSLLLTSVPDTTDSLGSFSIAAPDAGLYDIEARGILDGARLIRFNVKAVRDSTVVLSTDTMHRPGAIKIAISKKSDWADGYVYVPGTFIAAWLGARDTVTLDSVPAGTLPMLYYSQRSGTWRKVIRYDISVRSNETTLIRYPEWSFYRRVLLNTSSSGAAIAGDVYGFPVLIRLNPDNFDFSQAKTNETDIRFTKSNNAPLSYEIDLWDAAAQKAAIWVNVDTVRGNDSIQSIIMYWGNPSATDSSNSASAFDTSSGFQGVWHLDEEGNKPALDATANHYNGAAYAMSGASPVSGAIGHARAFDGASSYITMPNTANSKLNFPENGYYTVSAWVSLDAFDYVYRTIVAKGYEQYYLRFTSYPSDPLWEFVEFDQGSKWQTSTHPATEKQWTFLTGVRQGSSQYLYCNGEIVDSVTTNYSNVSFSRDTSNDLSVGRFLKEVTFPTNGGYCFFKGKIDELRISSVARNRGWIRLSYMNQRSDDRLVQFK